MKKINKHYNFLKATLDEHTVEDLEEDIIYNLKTNSVISPWLEKYEGSRCVVEPTGFFEKISEKIKDSRAKKFSRKARESGSMILATMVPLMKAEQIGFRAWCSKIPAWKGIYKEPFDYDEAFAEVMLSHGIPKAKNQREDEFVVALTKALPRLHIENTNGMEYFRYHK